MRDLQDYTCEYNKAGFEDYQVKYRKKKVIEDINRFKPRRIMEIGCGMDPLFLYKFDHDVDLFTVVEPGEAFYKNALSQAAEVEMDIKCINKPFSFDEEYKNDSYDMIICASLLHEIEEVESFCDDIYAISNDHTVIHFNVPNADSMHRELAKYMGIIESKKDFSERNRIYQQSRVFDRESLIGLIKRHRFEVIDDGSLFIKPFSHAQMYEMIENEIIDESVLDGLYKLSENEMYKSMGSELWCNARAIK